MRTKKAKPVDLTIIEEPCIYMKTKYSCPSCFRGYEIHGIDFSEITVLGYMQ
jgi:hypothetical protein